MVERIEALGLQMTLDMTEVPIVSRVSLWSTTGVSYRSLFGPRSGSGTEKVSRSLFVGSLRA